jgi:hypothetical protein
MPSKPWRGIASHARRTRSLYSSREKLMRQRPPDCDKHRR